MQSIQAKLTVAILVIFLVALSALGGLNYWKARSIITEIIIADTAKEAEKSAGDIGNWLEARKAELAMIAVIPAVQSGNTEAIVPILISAAKVNNIYASINYANLAGVVFSSSGATFNVNDRDYFQRALRGEITITDPLMARGTGKLVSTVVIPVKLDGKVTGVLFAGSDMEGISKMVLSVKAGQTGYASVTQGDGLRIIHPNPVMADAATTAGEER